MARPPRGRMPGSGRSSDETSDNELPLELPRVDPIRPRVTRPQRTEPKLDVKPEESVVENGPRRFVPPLRAAIPDPPETPRRMTPEKVDNPFDYYAMPRDESDPLSRPIAKPSTPAAEKSEYLTSKYYTPRRDLTAQRDFDDSEDQTANWARSVRPGRPVLETSSSEEDDTPLHLRHLPSRVRDHLRAEPRMPQTSEALGSFAQSAPTTTQLRARSGVPLPLAPELRAPVPQDVRVTRQIPDLPMPVFDDQQTLDDQQFGEDRNDAPLQTPQDLEAQLIDAFHDNARDDFANEPEFDSQSDEAVTEFDPRVAPLSDNLSVDEMARHALPDADSLPNERGRDEVNSAPVNAQSEMPMWMRRTEQVAPPPPIAVSDWDQDQALHALTSRIRSRAVQTMDRYNKPRTGLLKEKLFGAVGNFGTKIRDKARDVQDARRNAMIQKQAQDAARRDALQQNAVAPSPQDLRASRADEFEDAVPEFMVRPQAVVQDQGIERRPRWSFSLRRTRAPVVRVSAEVNRAQRRKRQSRLYEDIVAWIVVPPFIIGLIYGGLELAKFLSNSPLGKLLSGD